MRAGTTAGQTRDAIGKASTKVYNATSKASTQVINAGHQAYDKLKNADVWGTDPLALAAGHVKEAMAVFTFLLCNSRIGATDFMATPFIMLIVLIVYDMPFINPAVWFALRLGPYYSGLYKDGERTPTKDQKRNHLTNWITLFTMLTIQIIAITCAAAARNNMNAVFGVEKQNPIAYSGINSIQLTSTAKSLTYSADSTLSCSAITSVPYSKNTTQDSACFTTTGGLNMISWFILEEFGEHFILCVAMIAIYENIDRKDLLSRVSYVPGVLLGLNYAFPTALHGMHMIGYYLIMQSINGTDMWYTKAELGYRLGGAFGGTILAVLYYNFFDLIGLMGFDFKADQFHVSDENKHQKQPWLETKIERYQLLRPTP
jgi:hypothetical protein